MNKDYTQLSKNIPKVLKTTIEGLCTDMEARLKQLGVKDTDLLFAEVETIRDLHREEQKQILAGIQFKQQASNYEFTRAEQNLEEKIGSEIAQNYRKDMNEGKMFAYDDVRTIINYAFQDNFKELALENNITKSMYPEVFEQNEEEIERD